ncbi:NlpC/P60 family protein [Streptomyces sp. E11-3]|uniref:C40 family peptidase n=1 Tax=Streptomyces sp. E11-3 TaxID=3110112 RepID=UPI00397EDCD5
MSGNVLRLVCTATVVAAVLAGGPAVAVPAPEPEPLAGEPSVAELLTDLQDLYRKAEDATESYNATAEKLKAQKAETRRLGRALSKARLALGASRGAAGRLARQQYQDTSELSPYVRLLLARDPQHALDQGHLIRRAAAERAQTVGRLTAGERRAKELAAKSRKALDKQLTLAEKRKKKRDTVTRRLAEVERLLADLSAEQLSQLRELEESETARAQEELVASGALGSPAPRAPSRAGKAALRYAVDQIGKPYEWGAEGPATYDCSGLTSRAWTRAGRAIPRTSQEQWAELPRVPLETVRPGDLVVYFPEATHVALYLGDGMVVHAPRPGAKVKVSPIAANPLLGVVRPDSGASPMAGYVPPELPEGATEGSDLGYGEVGAPG